MMAANWANPGRIPRTIAAKSSLGSNWPVVVGEAPTNPWISEKPSERQTDGAETKAVKQNQAE